jgi:hypothetical protein
MNATCRGTRRDGVEDIRKLESAEEDVCLAAALYGVATQSKCLDPKILAAKHARPKQAVVAEKDTSSVCRFFNLRPISL